MLMEVEFLVAQLFVFVFVFYLTLVPIKGQWPHGL